ncbi:Histidine triad nucleotide-binding protein 3 [Galdieria sulphuraria]|nr:Histidine triad nucleotide-binding protein 3 [Galdieria sulphuraria]
MLEHWKDYFSPCPEDILYEDSQVVAFKDTSPQAARHYLVVPKVKIKGVEELSRAHIALQSGSYDSSRTSYLKYNKSSSTSV